MLTLDTLKLHSLAEVEQYYKAGHVLEEDLQEYIRLWNAGPRFGVAQWCDGAMRLHYGTKEE